MHYSHIYCVLVFLIDENYYKRNYIDIEKTNEIIVENLTIQENIINEEKEIKEQIPVIKQIKDIKNNIIEHENNKENIENSKDICEFDISQLLLTQGKRRFLMYQENLTRIKESNVKSIQGHLIKMLPKNVFSCFFYILT